MTDLLMFRCEQHGQCKNGTCLCVTGWNGRHCTLEGCPRMCSNNGQCRTNFHGAWRCECAPGWDGEDCATRLETACSDGQDNDGGEERGGSLGTAIGRYSINLV